MDRIERVNEQIKRQICQIIQEDLGDPRLTFVTIMDVSVSRDLRIAKVYYSVLGDSKAAEAAAHALSSAAKMIRKHVGARIKMRYTPEFHFYYDRSIETGARIEQAIEDIHHEQMEKNQNRD